MSTELKKLSQRKSPPPFTYYAALTGATTSAVTFMALTPSLGLIPGMFTILVGGTGMVTTFLALRRQKEPKKPSSLTGLAVAIGVSKDLQLKIEELHELGRTYELRNSPLFPSVNGVLANLQELFGRISEGLDEQSARLAAVKYSAILSKLNEALGKRYYLDIEAHPELWSNPEARMEAVEAALNATGEQIIRNIRQLNGSRDLVYQVSIESLMGLQSDAATTRELGIES